MALWFLIQLVVAVALLIFSYVLAPKPKKQKPPASRDADNPTSESGRAIPVVFGTLIVTGPNVLYFTDKAKYDYQVYA